MKTETGRRLFARLRQLRAERGLTQEKFAEEAGFKYKYYQAVEAGRKADLRLSTLERLAAGHGLEPWEMILPLEAAPAVEEAQAKYGSQRRRRSAKP